ncbi:MAG: hypothetical protein IPL50_05890 [Chitinophagaceae bacterium]|nr:hypothetical protein [Chitinophagaceae bacterium]
MVAVTGALVVLIAVKRNISLPPAASPMDVLLFVQLKLVPLTEPLNTIALVAAPLHRSWFAG